MAVAQPAVRQSFKKLIPLLDRVLVEKAEAVTKTKGGIVIPEKAQTKVVHGTVIAVGPGSRNQQGGYVKPAVKPGDRVLLPEYGGIKVELDDHKEYRLFDESDILAKVFE